MATPTTSFPLPAETLALLRALALPGESLSGVIGRAARALEAAPVAAPKAISTDALEALAARVARLGACIAPAHTQEPPVLQAAPTKDASASHSPLPGPPSYPLKVQQMALDMADQGARPAAIRAAVLDACGFEPGAKNWSKMVRAWRKAGES